MSLSYIPITTSFRMRSFTLVVLLLLESRRTTCLDNGLARTPPMGWLTWERFRCNTDCIADPNDCISENLIKSMANVLVTEGYRDVGYEYIIIDDCWLAENRSQDMRLQWDPVRFPSGIPALVDYVHQKGLKFGIYEDFGTKTCGGYPGSEFFLQRDAETFAKWGVDYVKFDGCNSDPADMDYGFKAFGLYLNQTGRPMVYSCEWPLYQQIKGLKPDYMSIQSTCNLWRNHLDVQDSWGSVSSILRYYGEDYFNLSTYAQPGAWNDPDMLVIGNFGLSYEQSKVQMVMWSIMASPLIMSNDLRAIDSVSKSLLQNKHLIAINQDPLGQQGKRIVKGINGSSVDVWAKPIQPAGSVAIAFLHLSNSGDRVIIHVACSELGLSKTAGYTLYNGFTGLFVMDAQPETMLTILVNPNGVEVITAVLKS